MKNEKFGFGGKKRGMKRNTKESADDISGYRQPRRPGIFDIVRNSYFFL